MRTRRKRQSLRLQLLALVLALALGWYSINPAPGPVRAREREAEPPNEGERRVAAGAAGRPVDEMLRPAGLKVGDAPPPQARAREAQELDWPEFIDFD